MSASLRIVARRETLRAHVFHVENVTISDGEETFSRDVVVHPGAVAIMAVRDDGRVGILRQYRATFDNVTWELPAGTRDVAGEDPRHTVQRELLEELGCRAGVITELYRYMNSRGWTDQVTILYEATDLTFEDRQPVGPEEASSEVHWLGGDELREIIASGEVVESSTLLAILHRVGATS